MCKELKDNIFFIFFSFIMQKRVNLNMQENKSIKCKMQKSKSNHYRHARSNLTNKKDIKCMKGSGSPNVS